MTTQSQIPAHTLRAAVVHGRMNRRAWLVTGALVVFQIINFADKAVIGLVADPAMRDLGLTAGEFGFIGSAFFFLFAVSAVAVGFLAGKVPTRWIILTMGISWAVLQFPMLFGGGAAVLLVTRILLGAAEGPATPISLQHVHGWFPAKERGLPSSLVAIGSTLGPIVAAPVLAWIIANPALGWRWAFGFLGIVGLLWSLCWLVVGRDGPYSHTRKQEEGAEPAAEETKPGPLPGSEARAGTGNSIADRADLLKIVPIRRILGTRMFVAAVLAGAGCFWAQGFLTTWSPKYLASVVALPPEMIGLFSTFPWILGALALLALGYGSRFLMRRGVTVRWALGALFGATLLCSGICFLLLPGLGGTPAVIVVTLGAGLAMTYPLAPTAVAFAVCSKQRAAVMATLTGLASLGGVIAPAMVGSLMDSAGYVPAPKGVRETAEMAALLAEGMNSAFWMIGIYLIVVGVGSVLLLNPDRTASRLQEKFVYNG
ncbi:MFS transporter [Arthrobacter mangrovi]|uniref:MFS transporter n=1 Tax=Arthrobacter mangrovi TaxID=2966350 RepID=A0ABQ5MYH9_9MICC|nr:MFS transporter [Arthrobacter mangrovi]GLB69003.1 MFS transporter [Arthrobacter mangrovi]